MSRVVLTTDGRVVGRRGREKRLAMLAALQRHLETVAWREVSVMGVCSDVECSPTGFYQYFTDLLDALNVLCAEARADGIVLPERVLEVARFEARQAGRVFRHEPRPDTAVVSTYRARERSVRAVMWTGGNEAEVQKLVGASRFYALEPEDRAASDDPEASASLLTSAHSVWVAVRDGRYVLLDAQDHAEMLTADAFEAAYAPEGGE